MNRERSRHAILQRNAAVSARNAKAVVPDSATRYAPTDLHWQRIARQMFETGHEEPAVMAELHRRGAHRYIAAQACEATRAHFRNVHHMAHRKVGLKGLAGGAALCVFGAVVFLLLHGVVVGGGLFISGTTTMVVGLYKALTGSSVPLVLPEDMPR